MARSPAPRNWQLDADPFAVEELEDLHAAIVEATQILGRIGGAIVIVADREQVADEMYVTNRYIFRWSSYAPATKKQEPVVEAVPDPEAVEAA